MFVELESAFQVLHGRVVDTSVVFPHKLGPPFKRALRNLASDHLQRIIQNDGPFSDTSGKSYSVSISACWPIASWIYLEFVRKLNFNGFYRFSVASLCFLSLTLKSFKIFFSSVIKYVNNAYGVYCTALWTFLD
jgi:hypothetical protein